MSTTGKKIERKYLAHFIDASFGGTTPNYVRLGQDLEEYNIELNPDVEAKKNILGENSVQHNGYEVQSETDPFYAYYGDPLFEQLSMIANERRNGDDCKTTVVDALFNEDGSCEWAYREDCYVIPKSMGGDTSGVQIPFSVYNAGNRKAGTFNISSKTFTESTSGGGSGGGSDGDGEDD